MSEVIIDGVSYEVLDALGHGVAEFYGPLIWLFMAGLGLTLLDLRFGVRAARKRGEEVRFSRAVRRTGDKIVNFFMWITVTELLRRALGVQIGHLFGVEEGVPVISLAVILIIYGIEINSCVNNYLECKGIGKRFSFFRLIRRDEIERAFEDKEGKEEGDGDDRACD